MSATPRTDEAAGYPTHEWEACAERLFECSAKLETELTHAREALRTSVPQDVAMARKRDYDALKESAEVSAALIAEMRKAMRDIHDNYCWGTFSGEGGGGDDRIGDILLAALAKTPESVGSDLAKLRDELGQFKASEQLLHTRYMRIRRILGAFNTDPTGENRFEVTEAKLNELIESVAQKDARIAEQNRCVNEGIQRTLELEAQRDALILAASNVVALWHNRAGEPVPDYIGAYEALQAAVKQSGNQPEVTEICSMQPDEFCELINAERKRQIEVKGWTHEHDDTHVDHELARLSAAFAMPASFRSVEIMSELCPWPDMFIPDPVFNAERYGEIIKAAALLKAEWERLRRVDINAARKTGGRTT